jgi:hypothetical protein
MEKNNMKSFDDFNNEWGAIEHPTGEFGTFQFDYGNKEANDLIYKFSEGDPNRVWTVVQWDGLKDRDIEVIVPRVALVNRIAYMVTRKPRVEGEEYESYLYWDFDNECSEDVENE